MGFSISEARWQLCLMLRNLCWVRRSSFSSRVAVSSSVFVFSVRMTRVEEESRCLRHKGGGSLLGSRSLFTFRFALSLCGAVRVGGWRLRSLEVSRHSRAGASRPREEHPHLTKSNTTRAEPLTRRCSRTPLRGAADRQGVRTRGYTTDTPTQNANRQVRELLQ